MNYDGAKVGTKKDGYKTKFLPGGFAETIASRRDIQIVVVDEASAYKHANTGRNKVFRRLFSDRAYIWALTGTPTPNGPPDAYGLGKLLGKTNGETYTSFHHRTMIQIDDYRWVPARGGYEAARELLQPAIRFALADVWDGPPMTTQRRAVALTEEQVDLIQSLKTDFVACVSKHGIDSEIVAVNAAAVRIKMLQVSLGAIYDENHAVFKIDSTPRYKELLQVIENTSGKILIFVPFTSVVDLLYEALKKQYPTERVTGGTSRASRKVIFRDFQERPEPRILVADPGCAAHGVNLYAASVVCWYGGTDKAELYDQGNKRAHRPGQKHPVTVVQFVSNKIEREIFNRLESKGNLQGLMLQAIREQWSWT
jgi:SNF2 family DNA or RNA helicase